MENMKQEWQDSDVAIHRDGTSYSDIINGRRRTALDKLARRYRGFSNMGLLLIPISFSWIFNPDLFPGHQNLRIIIGVWFSLYLLVASVMDRWLYNGIKSIDVLTMPVSEVVRKAIFYRKRHLQFVIVLLPIALGVIGVIAWNMDNLYFRVGVLVGAITGMAIGIRQLLDFLADYRSIISDDRD